MEYILLIVLILLSGFFSGLEISFFSLSESRIAALVKQKRSGAVTVARLKKNSQRLLITVLVGNNLVNIFAAAYATVVATNLAGSKGIGIATGMMTLLILLFGEIAPKSLAASHAERIALLTARGVYLLTLALLPVTVVLQGIIRIFGVKKISMSAVTEDEIGALTEVARKEGKVEAGEAEMIRNVFQLNDIKAEDVMTSLTEVFAIEATQTLDAVRHNIMKSPYSRIPVYERKASDIVGILYKDEALITLIEGKGKTKAEDVMEKPYFVPWGMHIDDLMRELQVRRTHMAIVVDEYGAMMGVATLEDAMEELVGEIIDETDIDERMIKRMSKNVILVDGKTEVRQVNKFFHVALPQEHETLASLFIDSVGKIPGVGESVKIGGVVLEVVEATESTVMKIQAQKV